MRLYADCMDMDVDLQMIVRHFKWDQNATEYDTRIFVVTEGISVRAHLLVCLLLLRCQYCILASGV